MFPASLDETGVLSGVYDAQNVQVGWNYVTGESVTETYDMNGRLIKLATAQGGYATLEYVVKSDRPAKITDNFGRQILFTYKSASLATVTTPDNKVYTFGYNTVGRLTSVTGPDGATRTYEYDQQSRKVNADLWEQLTGILDESQTRIANFYYNKYGQMTRNEHIGGVGQINVNKYGQEGTVVQTSTGALETYTFATIQGQEKATSRKVSCSDNSCTPTTEFMEYDSNGNLTSYTDVAGAKTCSAYDNTRNLLTRKVDGLVLADDCTSALGNPSAYANARVFDTQWHSTYRLPLVSTGPMFRTEYSYDAQQRLISHTTTATSDANGFQGITASATGPSRTISYTYNGAGQVLTESGPRTDVPAVTVYTYDASGNLLTSTNPLGQITRYSGYDAAGRPGNVTYPNGRIKQFTYDLKGRLTRIDEDTEATVFTYALTGLLTQVTLPSGVQLQYGYDTAQRLIKVQDDRGSRIDYTRDLYGNITSQKVFGPNATVAERQSSAIFDVLSRLRQSTGTQ